MAELPPRLDDYADPQPPPRQPRLTRDQRAYVLLAVVVVSVLILTVAVEGWSALVTLPISVGITLGWVLVASWWIRRGRP
jgi:xanthine/uracil permease